MAVLVPYDGSSPAHDAVEHAVETHDTDELVLLHVTELADGMLDAGVDIVQEQLKGLQNPASSEGLTEETQALLEDAALSFRMETTVGNPAREIVSFAEDNDITEIVMGSHGRRGVSRVLLGSVAETVVRRAPTTVTVVR
ncbi:MULTISPECIES: universal stress protein [Halobacterium]|uniref:UspA domain protein n=4 Tax=Halobacterium salinarum TaxID=2242 RepID=Q9HHV8_HALSA|nr:MULTISPECIES: universal stress protein [Halobacterium]AAG20868.1 Vng6205c [Halobacterium salinarum NRC-1]MBB6090622.1 nucleotide-binding universal stress UspA family protein [Halobacterium salinarum]MCF2164901.1 universal stress protein [Halobacterium salinarum]MCF2169005.1 universal stress protein [Halobacterium salinarum]MCF2208005.1 universal stress protein [Halobacterium salinarum]